MDPELIRHTELAVSRSVRYVRAVNKRPRIARLGFSQISFDRFMSRVCRVTASEIARDIIDNLSDHDLVALVQMGITNEEQFVSAVASGVIRDACAPVQRSYRPTEDDMFCILGAVAEYAPPGSADPVYDRCSGLSWARISRLYPGRVVFSLKEDYETTMMRIARFYPHVVARVIV